jgi:ribosomal protein S18 acetylase RimI-like enzyme
VTELSFRAVAAGPEHGPALVQLFVRAEVPCYCRYWHFAGTTNAWLDRCAHRPGENRAEMSRALETRNDEMSGIVALEQERAIGWMKVTPASVVPKLYAQRLYRGLSCFNGDRHGIFTIGCILVDPERRRSRVAESMLDRAVTTARERGGRALEAFPRRADDIADAQAWTGPFSLYTHAGFRVVHDFAPYPVMRLVL